MKIFEIIIYKQRRVKGHKSEEGFLCFTLTGQMMTPIDYVILGKYNVIPRASTKKVHEDILKNTK